jgi:diguanylate cyclase (GGDEF)-like protein
VKNLANSVILLLAYLFLVLGLAQIRTFELHVLYFQAAFFVIMTLAVFAGLINLVHYRLPIYSFLVFWAGVYFVVWQIYWRSLASPPDPGEVAIQFVLMEVAAGLAYNVGTHLIEIDAAFDSMASSAYPNRTLEMTSAGDRIQTEITRSRRYSRPLSLLILELDRPQEDRYKQQVARLERDLFKRFAMAKVGEIINSHARQTDLITRDGRGRFVVLCPETDSMDCSTVAERIQTAVAEDLGNQLRCGIASFPQETLEFSELLHIATRRLEENGAAGERLEEAPVERPAR